MASDLEEVQNVVDVSFGDMADEVEKFANSAVQNFGMSALTAKRMASTFMSMANGMGLAAKDGKNMSLQLTALAGDMASFYNVEQDVAQTALNSIFTGETESLKKFGIVLTEANLNAFALSRGITKSYNAMSQAEKVALRYQYVLKATANAQGDFARTSGSWANQVRILKEQWSQLLGILGKGLIAILTPLIQALNKLLSYLIAIGNAIASLFGGKKVTGVSKGLESAAGGASSLDDNLGSAGDKLDEDNKKAEKLAKTLASFDELDILTSKDKDKDSGSSSSDIGGGGGGFEVPDYNIEEMPSQTSEALEKLKALFEKFKPIIDAFIEGFNFERIKERFKEFLDNTSNNLKEFWDNLDTSRYLPALVGLFGSLGSFLGQLVYDTIDSIDMVFNGTFDAFEPALKEFIENTLPNLIELIDQELQTLEVIEIQIKLLFDDVWKDIEPILDTIGLILAEIQQKLNGFWQEYGKPLFDKIRETIQNTGETIRNIWNDIISPILDNVNQRLLELWEEHIAPYIDTLLVYLNELWNDLMDLWNEVLLPIVNWIVDTCSPSITAAFNSIWNIISEVIGNIFDIMGDLLNTLKGIIEFITGVFTGDWEKAWNGIKDIFKGIWDLMVDIVKTPINIIIGVINGMISAVVSGLNLVVRAINSIQVDIPDWVPLLGGKHIGFHLSEITAPQIPTLAKGGVLTSPTLAMVGEYAGASNNPEIVTPQSILKETIDASNGEVVSALYQMAQLLIAAINDVDMNVSIGDDVIAQSAKRGNDEYRNRTGKPLFA